MAKVDRSTGEILFSRPVLRGAYDDFSDRSHAGDLHCQDVSLADQSARDEADINVLVKRFGIGLSPMPVGARAPFFADISDLKSPHEMAQALVEAQATFMRLPAEVRSRFDNDPHAFVEFCSNDANYDDICDMGLLAPEPMQKRQEARKAAQEAELQKRVQAELAKQKEAEGSV